MAIYLGRAPRKLLQGLGHETGEGRQPIRSCCKSHYDKQNDKFYWGTLGASIGHVAHYYFSQEEMKLVFG